MILSGPSLDCRRGQGSGEWWGGVICPCWVWRACAASQGPAEQSLSSRVRKPVGNQGWSQIRWSFIHRDGQSQDDKQRRYPHTSIILILVLVPYFSFLNWKKYHTFRRHYRKHFKDKMKFSMRNWFQNDKHAAFCHVLVFRNTVLTDDGKSVCQINLCMLLQGYMMTITKHLDTMYNICINSWHYEVGFITIISLLQIMTLHSQKITHPRPESCHVAKLSAKQVWPIAPNSKKASSRSALPHLQAFFWQ